MKKRFGLEDSRTAAREAEYLPRKE